MPAKNKKASVTVSAGKSARQAASLLPGLEPACQPASQTASSPASSPALGAETIAHLPPDRHLPALKQALLDYIAADGIAPAGAFLHSALSRTDAAIVGLSLFRGRTRAP